MENEDIEEVIARYQRFAERFCAETGIPLPDPWTAEKEAAFQQMLRDGDAQVAALVARQQGRRD